MFFDITSQCFQVSKKRNEQRFRNASPGYPILNFDSFWFQYSYFKSDLSHFIKEQEGNSDSVDIVTETQLDDVPDA